MKKGYTEWVSQDPDWRVGFITNPFGRVLYVNNDWPDGAYAKYEYEHTKALFKAIKKDCKQGRTFTKAELMLELL